MKFPSQDYLLWFDRKTKTVRIATGRFRGKTWSCTREGFYRRDWKYVGVVDGHRVKRINYSNKPLGALLKKGLRKVFLSTLRQPRGFKWAS